MTNRPRGIHHLLLQTSDLDAAERFFLGFLGFTVRKREQFHDGRPLTVTNEGLGLTSGAPGGPRRVVEHIAFRSRTSEGSPSACRAAGDRGDQGARPGPYGLTVYLADPDGNRIELFSEDED